MSDTPSNLTLDQLIANYLQSVERGEEPDRELWMANHPDHADGLRAFFDDNSHFKSQVDSAEIALPATTIDNQGLPTGNSPRIGNYKILQQLGTGGMGEVWMAEQEKPVKRRVAIKLIKAGMDSKAVLARFDAERQALALMNHPNIAKVFDAGIIGAEDQALGVGRPFFAMELVRGIPITEYCDSRRLEIRDRLKLFRQCCSAVHHAHQKGIIHRDLKPSNVLVESHDDEPVLKVIDFGLAKAIGGTQLTEQTLFTAMGTVAGTPLYMAPEQAVLNALDIDIRADVFSLGVLLYELMTGTTPLTSESFKEKGLDELLRLIREYEPPSPSQRVSSSATLANIAALRQIEPKRLGRFVRGELDWIAMKSLAKERERRYGSALALSEDIDRYLNEEPVQASPLSTAYRLSKFAKKNRGLVAATTAVGIALALGIIGTSVGAWRAFKSKQLSEESEKKAVRLYNQATLDRDAKILALDALGKRNNELQLAMYRAGLQNALFQMQNGQMEAAIGALSDLPGPLRGWEYRILEQQAKPFLAKVDLPEGKRFFLGTNGFEASPEGGYVALEDTSSADQLCVMDTFTGKEIATLKLPNCRKILSCALSNRAKRVLVLYVTETESTKGLTSRALLWDRQTSKILWSRESSFQASGDLLAEVFISPNGDRGVASGYFGDRAKAADQIGGCDGGIVVDFISNAVGVNANERRVGGSRLEGEFSDDGNHFIWSTFGNGDGILDCESSEYTSMEDFSGLAGSRRSDLAYRRVGIGDQFALRLEAEWALMNFNGDKVATIITNPEPCTDVAFYDQSRCCMKLQQNKLVCWIAGSPHLSWTIAYASDGKLMVNERDRRTVLFGNNGIIYTFPLPSAMQILRLSRMLPDAWSSGTMFDHLGTTVSTGERLGDNLIPFEPVPDVVSTLKCLRDLETTSLIGFVQTLDKWCARDGTLYQVKFQKAYDYSDPAILLYSDSLETPMSEVEFEIDFERHYSPEPYVAPNGGLILLVASHMDRGKPDFVLCDLSQRSVENRFTAPVDIDEVIDFDGIYAWLISNEEIVKVRVSDSSVEKTGISAQCASLSRDRRQLASAYSNHVAIRSFPTLDEIWSTESTTDCSELHWFEHEGLLFAETARTIDCISMRDRCLLLSLPNDYSDYFTYVPSVGQSAILGSQIYSSNEMNQIWKDMQETEDRELLARSRAKDFLIELLENSEQPPSRKQILENLDLNLEERLFAAHLLSVSYEACAALDDEEILDQGEALSYFRENALRSGTDELLPVFERVLKYWEADAATLNAAAWRAISRSNSSFEEYEQALDRARRACKQEPENSAFANTLGVAQFRCSLFEEAIATLQLASDGNRDNASGLSSPYDSGFLAIAFLKTGKASQAEQALSEFRRAIGSQNSGGLSDELAALKEEIEGAFASDKSD